MNLHLTQEHVQLILSVVKILVIFGAVLTSVPFMVLAERILLARIQQRVGPNRVGLDFIPGLGWLKNKFIIGGILQTMIDGAKLLLKEDTQPRVADKVLHSLAPILTIVPAIMILAIIPFAPAVPVKLFGYSILMPISITELPIGILFYLAVTGIAVYGIVLAGWSSNSKYSLLGGIRSSAQMISYEISLGLALAPLLLIAGTFTLVGAPGQPGIVDQQAGWIWNWYVFKQPIAFFLFMIAGFAECNRLPFDLPEGESELGGGFNTEYSSMKFAMFFMAEYMNMFAFAALLATLFLGGFNAPVPLGITNPYLAALAGLICFTVKVGLIILFMIFVRGTLPRFRYDQLMDLGWKLMLPVALINLIITAGIMAFQPRGVGENAAGQINAGTVALLFIAGVIQIAIVDRILTARRKRVLGHAA